MMQRSTAGLYLLCLVVSAAACTPLCAADSALEGKLDADGRRLQTVIAGKVADKVQDTLRSAGAALSTAVASAFTRANIELAKAAYDKVAAALLEEAQPAAASPAQPVAQVVSLPSQDTGSGINLHTRTPVDIRNPVTVDTPVQQDSVQLSGLPWWLGGRRLL